MDGNVDPAREQRLLELLDEDAARADLAERRVRSRSPAVVIGTSAISMLPTTLARAAARRPAQPG
jgi:hypothetical protein